MKKHTRRMQVQPNHGWLALKDQLMITEIVDNAKPALYVLSLAINDINGAVEFLVKKINSSTEDARTIISILLEKLKPAILSISAKVPDEKFEAEIQNFSYNAIDTVSHAMANMNHVKILLELINDLKCKSNKLDVPRSDKCLKYLMNLCAYMLQCNHMDNPAEIAAHELVKLESKYDKLLAENESLVAENNKLRYSLNNKYVNAECPEDSADLHNQINLLTKENSELRNINTGLQSENDKLKLDLNNMSNQPIQGSGYSKIIIFGLIFLTLSLLVMSISYYSYTKDLKPVNNSQAQKISSKKSSGKSSVKKTSRIM